MPERGRSTAGSGFVPSLARAGTFPVSYDVAWG